MEKKEYKAIIVEDERLIRNELKQMIASFPEIAVVGEASTLDEAKQLIETSGPDVLFLDIQLHNQTAFDLLNKINYPGHIIFITAYNQYAVRAFELNALDYLLKPVTMERLAQSISRLSGSPQQQKIPDNRFTYDDFIFLPWKKSTRFVKINTLLYIKAEGNYTMVHTSQGDQSLILKPMTEWEERLPEQHFCRIHRSLIVNLNYIEKIERWKSGHQIKLTGTEETLPISRRYAKQLLKQKK